MMVVQVFGLGTVAPRCI